jgi:predicted ribosomally synthesized peptide with nif11-like leader
MSIENLKKYGKMCEENPEVRAHAKEIGLKDFKGQVAYAKSLGVEFSRDDLESLAKEAGLNGKDELSEEDLKKVAGGLLTMTAVVVGFLVGGGAAGAAAANRPGW